MKGLKDVLLFSKTPGWVFFCSSSHYYYSTEERPQTLNKGSALILTDSNTLGQDTLASNSVIEWQMAKFLLHRRRWSNIRYFHVSWQLLSFFCFFGVLFTINLFPPLCELGVIHPCVCECVWRHPHLGIVTNSVCAPVLAVLMCGFEWIMADVFYTLFGLRWAKTFISDPVY